MRCHEPLFDRFARGLARTGISPNALTLAALPPALAAGVCAAQGWFLASAVLFGLSGMADLLDGALARASGRGTRFGALLDSSLDRVTDGCIPVGLILFYAPHGLVVLIPAAALLVGLWIPYIRARAQSLDLALPRLWMRREDRFVAVMAALAVSPWLWAQKSVPGLPVLVVLAGIALLGTLAGGLALRAAARADRPQAPGGDG